MDDIALSNKAQRQALEESSTSRRRTQEPVKRPKRGRSASGQRSRHARQAKKLQGKRQRAQVYNISVSRDPSPGTSGNLTPESRHSSGTGTQSNSTNNSSGAGTRSHSGRRAPTPPSDPVDPSQSPPSLKFSRKGIGSGMVLAKARHAFFASPRKNVVPDAFKLAESNSRRTRYGTTRHMLDFSDPAFQNDTPLDNLPDMHARRRALEAPHKRSKKSLGVHNKIKQRISANRKLSQPLRIASMDQEMKNAVLWNPYEQKEQSVSLVSDASQTTTDSALWIADLRKDPSLAALCNHDEGALDALAERGIHKLQDLDELVPEDVAPLQQALESTVLSRLNQYITAPKFMREVLMQDESKRLEQASADANTQDSDSEDVDPDTAVTFDMNGVAADDNSMLPIEKLMADALGFMRVLLIISALFPFDFVVRSKSKTSKTVFRALHLLYSLIILVSCLFRGFRNVYPHDASLQEQILDAISEGCVNIVGVVVFVLGWFILQSHIFQNSLIAHHRFGLVSTTSPYMTPYMCTQRMRVFLRNTSWFHAANRKWHLIIVFVFAGLPYIVFNVPRLVLIFKGSNLENPTAFDEYMYDQMGAGYLALLIVTDLWLYLCPIVAAMVMSMLFHLFIAQMSMLSVIIHAQPVKPRPLVAQTRFDRSVSHSLQDVPSVSHSGLSVSPGPVFQKPTSAVLAKDLNMFTDDVRRAEHSDSTTTHSPVAAAETAVRPKAEQTMRISKMISSIMNAEIADYERERREQSSDNTPSESRLHKSTGGNLRKIRNVYHHKAAVDERAAADRYTEEEKSPTPVPGAAKDKGAGSEESDSEDGMIPPQIIKIIPPKANRTNLSEPSSGASISRARSASGALSPEETIWLNRLTALKLNRHFLEQSTTLIRILFPYFALPLMLSLAASILNFLLTDGTRGLFNIINVTVSAVIFSMIYAGMSHAARRNQFVGKKLQDQQPVGLDRNRHVLSHSLPYHDRMPSTQHPTLAQVLGLRAGPTNAQTYGDIFAYGLNQSSSTSRSPSGSHMQRTPPLIYEENIFEPQAAINAAAQRRTVEGGTAVQYDLFALFYYGIRRPQRTSSQAAPTIAQLRSPAKEVSGFDFEKKVSTDTTPTGSTILQAQMYQTARRNPERLYAREAEEDDMRRYNYIGDVSLRMLDVAYNYLFTLRNSAVVCFITAMAFVLHAYMQFHKCVAIDDEFHDEACSALWRNIRMSEMGLSALLVLAWPVVMGHLVLGSYRIPSGLLLTAVLPVIGTVAAALLTRYTSSLATYVVLYLFFVGQVSLVGNLVARVGGDVYRWAWMASAVVLVCTAIIENNLILLMYDKATTSLKRATVVFLVHPGLFFVSDGIMHRMSSAIKSYSNRLETQAQPEFPFTFVVALRLAMELFGRVYVLGIGLLRHQLLVVAVLAAAKMGYHVCYPFLHYVYCRMVGHSAEKSYYKSEMHRVSVLTAHELYIEQMTELWGIVLGFICFLGVRAFHGLPLPSPALIAVSFVFQIGIVAVTTTTQTKVQESYIDMQLLSLWRVNMPFYARHIMWWSIPVCLLFENIAVRIATVGSVDWV